MYGYIYLTENIITGMCYIGKRTKPKFQKSYIGSGTHLRLAINKYGRENFVCQPIQWCETKEELCSAEKYWIEKCNAINSECFYNIAPGGEGGYAPGELNGRYGKHTNGWTEETRKHVSEVRTGIKQGPMSEETKKKISEARKGIPGGHPCNKGEKNPMFGKHHSDESKKKMSEVKKGQYSGEKHPLYGKHHSEEAKRKMSLAKQGKYDGANNPSYGRHWKLVDGHRQYLD